MWLLLIELFLLVEPRVNEFFLLPAVDATSSAHCKHCNIVADKFPTSFPGTSSLPESITDLREDVQLLNDVPQRQLQVGGPPFRRLRLPAALLIVLLLLPPATSTACRGGGPPSLRSGRRRRRHVTLR